MQTHPRIRKYVMVGADLPPPELNRVKEIYLSRLTNLFVQIEKYICLATYLPAMHTP